MYSFLTFLLMAILAMFLARAMRGPKPIALVPVRRAAPASPSQLAMTAPQLETIEWTEPRAEPRGNTLEAKLRDRYAAARFPGVFDGTGRAAPVEHVIHAARRYFEDDKLDRAHELLALSIARSPHEARLPLARIEIAFLARDPSLFIRLARDFHGAHPGHSAWRDVARLGHAIAPEDRLFASHSGVRGHDHYGPWPDMPNWIEASWDLTPEVLASDFHRAMSALARRPLPADLQRVA